MALSLENSAGRFRYDGARTLKWLVPVVALSALVSALGACGTTNDSAPAGDIPDGSFHPDAASPALDGSDASDAGDASDAPAATPGSARFLVVGDTGRGNANQSKVANAMSAKCMKDGCDFVLLLGDNLYDVGAISATDPIWKTHFEAPYAAIDLDFFAVLGNHDYGSHGTDFQRGRYQVDYTSNSKKWKMPAPYYHFTKSHIDFFALDTNMQLFGQAVAQKADVTSWLAESTAEWRIAIGHHPYLSNGPHGNAGTYDDGAAAPWDGATVKTFFDDVVCGKVDVYFSGHDHSLQWMNATCKGTELGISGAGSATTTLPGKNPALFQSLRLGFMYVFVEGKKLTAEILNDDAQVEFVHTITKP